MKHTKMFFLATALAGLSGCATVVSGTSQSLFVDTPEVEGADCELTDSNNGTWFLEDTPGSVTVAKGNGPMNIVCKKDGYKTATLSVEETFAGATLGNVILGGGIGVFVDAASGAAQEYPDKAVVWMEPKKWKSMTQKEEWMEKKQAHDDAIAKAKAEAEANRGAPHQGRRR